MDQLFASEFRATDVGEVEAHLRANYGAVALSDAPLLFGERARGDSEFATIEHDYSGSFTIGGELDVVFIGVPSRAEAYRWEVEGESGRGSGQPVLFQPGQRFVTHVDHVALRAVTFDRAALRRTAAALFGVEDADVRFASARPRSTAIGRLWASLVEFATERDDSAYVLAHASLRSALTRLLLEAFPLADRSIERRATAVGRWLGYRRAAEFIDDNASLPLTLADIARASGLSHRELDAAFRAHSRGGATALAYLRRARLDAARADLVAADPRLDGVTEIARRWGFVSPVRFARHFREAFGVDPGEVLRRSE